MHKPTSAVTVGPGANVVWAGSGCPHSWGVLLKLLKSWKIILMYPKCRITILIQKIIQEVVRAIAKLKEQ